jgi:hypothetical protein
MIVSICPRSFSLIGPVVIRATADSNTRSNQRRLSRTATLDGGVAITDGGFSDGDRTIEIRPAKLTAAIAEDIEDMARLSLSVTLSVDSVVWDAVMMSYSLGASPRLTLAVRQRLTE